MRLDDCGDLTSIPRLKGGEILRSSSTDGRLIELEGEGFDMAADR